ncbi:NAD-dependent epimerase/dehydratase family protein [Pseudoalteromonas xiamenensis]|uniref:NAD-dependent epimerase/dehydratase family protein n=1 Tax=Pseudoalteromonas xiamenensis TaxID=882626 RepID=UPI0035EAEC04
MEKAKLLILGSNGFIGKNAVEYFINNEYQVFSPKRAELNLLDTKSVESYLKKVEPDFVLMSAVNISSFEENVQIYFNLQRCSHFYKKMITIGSGAEYDMRAYHPKMKESYFKENTPADTYGLSKFVIGSDVESRSNIINLRVFGIFGKYEDYTRRFISNNICRALAGFDISLNQDMLFDYIYIDDFLSVLPRVFEQKTKFKNYNVCSNSPVSLLTLAKEIKKVHGSPVSIKVKQEGSRGEYSGDNARFTQEFGDFKETPFSASIKTLYDWYKKHPELDSMIANLKA